MCVQAYSLQLLAQRMACAFQAPSVVITLDKEVPLVELVIGCVKQCINILDSYMARQGVDLGAF